ncbi:hypothetical protein V7O66_01040 [Methanolobus sp. ZRKC3]|uniref:hypothetical protein n=1 Tax=Methanolobus sp. ZRKC3 TaxID=3125786 RepID=UPI00324B82F7
MDQNIVIEGAIKTIAEEYDFDVKIVRYAASNSEVPMDLVKMVDEGIYCFRGPNDNIRYGNASLCLSNKILRNSGVAKILLPLICDRINDWDRENIEDLLSLLKKSISIMELNPDTYPGFESCGIDPENFPTEKIPDGLSDKHKVWAMDKKGMCLVGDEADQLIHIDELRG